MVRTDIARRILEFLVYSNVYLAAGAAIVAVMTMFLLGTPFAFEAALIPFSQAFLIYNMNRFTDTYEDEINLPHRKRFTESYGKKIIACAMIIYAIALYAALNRNLPTTILALLPIVFGFLYSSFRMKRFFALKNIMVAVIWATSSLTAAAFFGVWSSLLAVIYAFFAAEFLINVIVFDVKDVKGDRANGIRTIPERFGFDATKKICASLYVMLCIILAYLLLLSAKAIVLVPFVAFIGIYLLMLSKDRNPWWYFGTLVDGEFYVLLISLAAYAVI